MSGVRPPNFSTRLRRDGWPVGGGVTFILHGLHLHTFAISLHICAGVNLSFIFFAASPHPLKNFLFQAKIDHAMPFGLVF